MRKDGRHGVTVTKECFDILSIAQELANVLNDDLSMALPQLKSTPWSRSDVLALACIDWIIATKKKHNKKITLIEKAMLMKFPYMKQPKGDNIKISNPFPFPEGSKRLIKRERGKLERNR
jgi:hypothetical protein